MLEAATCGQAGRCRCALTLSRAGARGVPPGGAARRDAGRGGDCRTAARHGPRRRAHGHAADRHRRRRRPLRALRGLPRVRRAAGCLSRPARAQRGPAGMRLPAVAEGMRGCGTRLAGQGRKRRRGPALGGRALTLGQRAAAGCGRQTWEHAGGAHGRPCCMELPGVVPQTPAWTRWLPGRLRLSRRLSLPRTNRWLPAETCADTSARPRHDGGHRFRSRYSVLRRYIEDALAALLGAHVAAQLTLRHLRDASSLGAAVLAAAAVRGPA